MNIIDRRKHPYRWKAVDAIVEPTWHDNSVGNSDQVAPLPEERGKWLGYADMSNVPLHAAIRWAEDHSDNVTLYIYDVGEISRLFDLEGNEIENRS